MSPDMLMPSMAEGKDFLIFGSTSTPGNNVIVVTSLLEMTNVTLYDQRDRRRHFILANSLDVVIFQHFFGAQKMRSSEPVCVTMFTRPACYSEPSSDISSTAIVPNDLFYSQYSIVLPAIELTTIQMIILIPESKIFTLSYNKEPIVRIHWTEIIGSKSWVIGEKALVTPLSQVSAEHNFGCYVIGIGSNMMLLQVVGFQTTQECVTSPQKSDDGLDNDCDWEIDEELSNYEVDPSSKISSVGTEFMFTVGRVLATNQLERLVTSVHISSYSSNEIEVKMETRNGPRKVFDVTTTRVKPKYVAQIFMARVSKGVKYGMDWRTLLFICSSKDEFSLAVVIEKSQYQISSFVALPTSSWGKEYSCFTHTKEILLIAINLVNMNELIVFCGFSQKLHKIPGLTMYHVSHITFCNDPNMDASKFGVYLSGKYPFGLFTVAMSDGTSCDNQKGFVSEGRRIQLFIWRILAQVLSFY
ncbi:hypothetical protein Btru_014698 [Bulinus truncatus]|nr:hypothetical protein Btru_014698 [Bulinus truncatus]